MNTILLIWNIVLTIAVIYAFWRQFTFEKAVQDFSRRLMESLTNEKEAMISLCKKVTVIFGAVLLFRLFRNRNESSDEQI